MQVNKYDDVYDIVSQIPRGKVLTYGDVAKLAGLANPRHVGFILHHNPDPSRIPCHRVVNSKGELAEQFAFGGSEAQRRMLNEEEIIWDHERVNLEICRWNEAFQEL